MILRSTWRALGAGRRVPDNGGYAALLHPGVVVAACDALRRQVRRTTLAGRVARQREKILQRTVVVRPTDEKAAVVVAAQSHEALGRRGRGVESAPQFDRYHLVVCTVQYQEWRGDAGCRARGVELETLHDQP